MQQRAIGKSGIQVSAIGLGCNNFGWLIDAQASNAVIARALDLGITFFDTADVYGDSEIVLGKALAGRRKDVVIATKFGIGRNGQAGGASRDYVLQAVERSLERLGTDYIDILYLHRPDPAVPLEETLGAFEQLIRQGKVRHAAASNMTPELLREAAAAAAAKHLEGFIATQEHYNLLVRKLERTLAPQAQQLGMGIIPYFPLESGVLTGKYRRGAAPAPGTRLDAWKQLAATLSDENFDKIERLQAFADANGHTLAELAIAWLLAKPYVPSVIAGATKPTQIEANCRAADWRLTAAQLAEVERLVPVAA
ncbi:MAG TPA: aldo/keto reductase [Steroidobacteraceae bacterium]|nr:aldo/keto reductase [Steroidobacteraceae bacterium]